jgi:FtsP/CotA-like multicopper oxidase with cupredoxin domain
LLPIFFKDNLPLKLNSVSMFKSFVSVGVALSLFSTVISQINPLIIPDTLSSGNYNLNLQTGSVPFFSGANTSTFGANGNILGPTLILNRYDTVQINVQNNLGEPTTLHWHGLHVSSENDGGPHTVIMPVETWSPEFKVLDWAGTYWYHPHLHHHTNEHVQKGIAGLIIVRDNIEGAITLPRTYGVDDFPLVLQTKAFDVNNQIVVESALDTVVLVNATYKPYLDVPAQVVRLRLLNGSSERYYNLGIQNDYPFYMIASDGGLLPNSVELTRLMIAPGERVEILVDLSALEGQSVNLMSFASELPNAIYGALQPGMGGGQTIPDYTSNPLNGNDFNILQLNVVASTVNAVTTIPTTLVSHNPWQESDADITRSLTFTPVNMGPTAIQGPFLINNVTFDMDVINYYIPLDNVEIWTLTNSSPISHPFHIHDVHFYILDINGAPPPPHLQGRKDVVNVPAGNGVVRFITKFEDYANVDVPYMYHCHMLTHEDDGMMGQFIVHPPCSRQINEQPADVYAAENTNVQFSVVMNDPNDTFQWQSDVGFGYTNLSNAGQYSGVNTAVLTVSNVTLSNNNQIFRCLIGDDYCMDTTSVATLFIGELTINELVNKFAVFPNPVSNQFTILSENSRDLWYRIYNVYGEVIIAESNELIVQAENWSGGVYFVEIINTGQRIKVIKN